MTFLGTATRKLEEAPIPSNLGSDVTMVQKKRLALLAQMGLGPGASAGNVTKDRVPARAPRAPSPTMPGPAPGSQDRKAQMLERERRIREEEENAREKEAQELREKQAKRKNAGLQSLGAVEPRKEVALPLPTPAAFYPSTRSSSSGPSKLELRIPMDTSERVKSASDKCLKCGAAFIPGGKFCIECGAKRPPEPPPPQDDEDDDSDDDEPAEAVKVAPGQWKRPAPVQQVSKKKGKKKKKRKERDELDDDGHCDEDWDENPSDGEDGQEEQVLRMLRDLNEKPGDRTHDPYEKARQKAREEGKIYKNMVVGSVKGMVSNDYKGFTDADLERRFQLPDSGGKGSLMSEEQVLQMINKERGEKNSVATQRRIQREQAEWQEKLKEHKARESKERFERMVVGRK